MGTLGEINRVSNGLDDRIINCLYQRQPFGQPITVPFVLQYLANKSLSPLFACLSPRVFIKHHNNTWPDNRVSSNMSNGLIYLSRVCTLSSRDTANISVFPRYLYIYIFLRLGWLFVEILIETARIGEWKLHRASCYLFFFLFFYFLVFMDPSL